MEHFSLPGYRVHELVGFGATGEVWRATELSTGEQVALKRLIAGSDPLAEPSAAAADLRREAALLASVRHEHVLRLRSVRPTSAGLVLVLDFAAGGSLAGLLAARGSLSAGEVVTIGAPLAQALAEVHAQGVMHGDITPANVLFTADGKPLLADLGVATLAGEDAGIRGLTPEFADPALLADPAVPIDAAFPRSGPSAAALRAADVFGLAATCLAALDASAPGTIRATIESAMVADPRSRPDAASFSRALFACCAPEPIRLVGATVDPLPVPPTHRFDRPSVVARPAAAVGPERGRLRRLAGGSARQAAVAGRLVLRRSALLFAAGSLVAVAVAGGVVWASRSSATPIAAPSTAVTRVAAGSDSAPAASAPAAAAAPESTPAAAAPESTPAAPAASPSPTSSGASAPPDWSAILTALDQLRDRAFDDSSVADLDLVYLPTAAALASDRATLGRLVTAGEHAAGFGLQLVGVSLEAVSSPVASSGAAVSSGVVAPPGGSHTGTVTLLVEDTLPAYAIIDAAGTSVSVPGRGDRRWLVVLSDAGQASSWRIASIATA